MKKITPKKYAQALYELVADKERKEISSSVERFVRLMADNNDLSKVDAMVKEFERLWDQRKGIVATEVVTAEEFNSEVSEEVRNTVKQLSGEQQVEINSKVDKSILGGIIIKYRDKRIDGSLKTQISRLRNKLYN